MPRGGKGKMRVQTVRRCEWCREPFESFRATHRHCGRDCYEHSRRRAMRERRVCRLCGDPLPEGSHVDRVWCGQNCRREAATLLEVLRGESPSYPSLAARVAVASGDPARAMARMLAKARELADERQNGS